jgi:hypothetical protein
LKKGKRALRKTMASGMPPEGYQKSGEHLRDYRAPKTSTASSIFLHAGMQQYVGVVDFFLFCFLRGNWYVWSIILPPWLAFSFNLISEEVQYYYEYNICNQYIKNDFDDSNFPKYVVSIIKAHLIYLKEVLPLSQITIYFRLC